MSACEKGWQQEATEICASCQSYLSPFPVPCLRPSVLQFQQLMPPHGLGNSHRVICEAWRRTKAPSGRAVSYVKRVSSS